MFAVRLHQDVLRASAVVLLLVVSTADPAEAQPSSCTALGQTTYVRDMLQEMYLWYRDLPDLDPADYPTPEAYLDAARLRPRDTTFSYVTSRAASDAFYSESQFIGLGLSTSLVGGELRVLQVFEDSPAAEAGLDRGSRIDAVDGRSVETLIAEGATDGAFGPAEDGLAVAATFTTSSGERRDAVMRKRPVTIPTVSLTRVFDVQGRRVGYLFFRNFVRPSVAALDSAFATLRDAGVTELVLDLRYNGGGLVDVAVHLASLIGGAPVRDQVFAQSQHNDRNRRLDAVLRFGNPRQALPLRRVVVIATRASASASELVINGLAPFVPVTIVGDRTYGKPVGQYLYAFCDKVLAPVSFAMVNADGQGDYFDGLPVDCPAPDDIGHQLGDAEEGSLREALRFLATGSCSTAVTTGASVRRSEARPRGSSGWQMLLNAH
jgi:C-terminal processing protease CtpA/Prc